LFDNDNGSASLA